MAIAIDDIRPLPWPPPSRRYGVVSLFMADGAVLCLSLTHCDGHSIHEWPCSPCRRGLGLMVSRWIGPLWWVISFYWSLVFVIFLCQSVCPFDRFLCLPTPYPPCFPNLDHDHDRHANDSSSVAYAWLSMTSHVYPWHGTLRNLFYSWMGYRIAGLLDGSSVQVSVFWLSSLSLLIYCNIIHG